MLHAWKNDFLVNLNAYVSSLFTWGKYDLLPVLQLAVSKSRLRFRAVHASGFVRLTNVSIAYRGTRHDEVEFS